MKEMLSNIGSIIGAGFIMFLAMASTVYSKPKKGGKR